MRRQIRLTHDFPISIIGATWSPPKQSHPEQKSVMLPYPYSLILHFPLGCPGKVELVTLVDPNRYLSPLSKLPTLWYPIRHGSSTIDNSGASRFL